ncbi:Chaperone protein DnaJ [Rhynchospora pubera]|uniref:Chaperone protein DnaJ n=1 Tax=Rhynchospora pubera TaxID=906938 RepID=A0AAV8CAQ1_9POAL|nr:Chaperone protein DnaJ [Rhynchospora pubera]
MFQIYLDYLVNSNCIAEVGEIELDTVHRRRNRMRSMAATWKNIPRTIKPTSSPTRSHLLQYLLPASFSSRSSKSHYRETWGSQDSSKVHVRVTIRQKRADAKSALKNLLFNGKPVQQGAQDQTQRQKKLKARQLNSMNEKRRRERGYERGNFTWTWGGESFTFPNSCPNGFEWRDNSNWHQNQNKKFLNESDVEDEGEERFNVTDLTIHRTTLGLPHTGSLELDQIKSAFRSAALKWHPDKHEGPSKAIAEEKFKLCVDAYKALSLFLSEQQ